MGCEGPRPHGEYGSNSVLFWNRVPKDPARMGNTLKTGQNRPARRAQRPQEAI